MAALHTAEPPFDYNPECKPKKSILKRHKPSSTSWLARFGDQLATAASSSPSGTANQGHQSQQQQQQPQQQRPLALFRKLVASTPLPTPAVASASEKQKNEDDPAPLDDQLDAKQLKRVRFPLAKLTTEYFPYATNSDTTATKEPIASPTSPIPIVGSAPVTTGNILIYYEQACKNKDTFMLPPLAALITQPQHGLTFIDLTDQPLTRRHMEPLADMLCLDFGLQTLKLRNCQLEEDSLRILLHSLLVANGLQHLDLSYNSKIQLKGFKYISIFVKNSNRLQSLDLSGTTPDKKAVQYLGQSLMQQSSRSLSSLILDRCAFRAPHLEALSGAVRRAGLEHLSLKHNQLNQQAALHIGVMLRDYDDESNGSTSQNGIRALVLDNNDLRQGIQYVAQALRRNHSLRSLSLVDCKLDAAACGHIAEALKYNGNLQSVVLARNPLGANNQLAGINALKQALYVNHALVDLNLTDCQLGSAAAIALAECLPESKSLNKLDLAHNPQIDMGGLLALVSGLRLNKSLTFLDINIPNADAERIKVQADMAVLCDRNARLKQEQQHDSDTSSSHSSHGTGNSSSSNWVTTTQATARLSLQERLTAVTRGKNTRPSSMRASPPPPAATPSPPSPPTVDYSLETSQAELLEAMLGATQHDTVENEDAIVQVYHRCRQLLDTLNQDIPQLVDTDAIGPALSLSDRLSAAIATYDARFIIKAQDVTAEPQNAPDLPDAPSPFEIGDDDEDEDAANDIHQLRKEKECEEGLAFKRAKEADDDHLEQTAS
ncbi:hypothetical protein BC940DRAFT_336230 [Gongronella butleri]|nr:hypothetical protein BC940DRAFT_336230 [Gongronella butleri]